MVASKRRENWGSRIGFILAASGAAVGLGNIQRFPHVVAEGGGAAFLVIYLLCVLLVGIPMIFVEFAIGRSALSNPSFALKKLSGGSRFWSFVGFFSILTAFIILSYYIVVAGWTLAYTLQYTYSQAPVPLKEFNSRPLLIIGSAFAFQLINMWIISRGVKAGIEKYSKVLLPLLFFLLITLVVRAVSLPGSWEGVVYYLKPDFSVLSPKSFIVAMGQAFFSLSLGEAVLITYASFAPKKENLPLSGFSIAVFDTFVAVLAGLIVFPALFALGSGSDVSSQGSTLLFVVMPDLITKISYGQFFGLAFFLLLGFAALTTCIALFEITVTFLLEHFGLKRKKAIFLVGALSFLLSVPVALSHGASPYLSNLNFLGKNGLYDIVDFLWGGLAMVFNGLMLAVFVGWVWGAKKASEELKLGSPRFSKVANFWGLYIKFIVPLLIGIVFLGLYWE